jgi:aspartyl-tRNA(Asn)/glutamyl-tRNA(Gln) amidotransferase subunit A
VPFAIGSETNGSILTPGAFCGLSGLRPTYGRVSRHGAMALCWTLDKLGPMCRSIDDAALVLAAIAGPDPHDATTVDERFHWERPAASKRFRIGVPRHATVNAQPEVAAAFEESVKVLAQFADVERDVAWPDLPYNPAVGVIVDAEGGAAFRELIESGRTREMRAAADKWGGYPMLMTFAADYIDALRVRVPVRRAMDELLTRYDALAMPTRSGVAPLIGYDFDKQPSPSPSPTPTPAPSPSADAPQAPSMISAGNLAGLPAVCVPNGFGRHGLPTSLHLMGRAFDEATIAAIADRFQSATDWHQRRPPTPA